MVEDHQQVASSQNESRAHRFLGLFALVSVATIAPGCVATYSVRPDSAYDLKPPTSRLQTALHYRVDKPPFLAFDGDSSVKDEMANNGVFTESIPATMAPEKGVFVTAAMVDTDPSTNALIWGYISMSTAHIIPCYLGSGGFLLRYTVFVDKQQMKVYEYDVTRKMFVWLPLLPFTFVNAFTDSTNDAFAAVTRQFFADALQDGVFERHPVTPAAVETKPQEEPQPSDVM